MLVHVPPALALLPTPTPLSPPDNSWVADNTPLFRWTSVEGADSYQILVDNDSDFTSPEINDFPLENQYTPTVELAEMVIYYWKVRARNSSTGDTSGWSGAWRFRVDITAPAAPDLLQPENGENLLVDQPLFTWTTVTDPSGITYLLEIDNDPDFSSPYYSKLLTENSHQAENKLVENFSPYYWRVIAIDGAGNENPSAVYRFNLKVFPSSSIGPISPYWQNAPFTLTATATDNDGLVENVEFWYRYSSDNINWGNWILYDNDSTPPYSRVFAPPANGFYQFYSRAWDDKGNYENAPAEPDACCGYDDTPPATPENLLPENGAELETATVGFSWSGIVDLSGVVYEFVLDNENEFLEPYIHSETLTDNSLTLTLELGGYWWRVRAVDGAQNTGPWSTQYFFVRGWVTLEGWTSGLTTAADWKQLEELNGQITTPRNWLHLDDFIGSVIGGFGWSFVEALSGTCSSLACWLSLEHWASSSRCLIYWSPLEHWLGSCSASAGWWPLEAFLGLPRTSYFWFTLDSLESRLNSPTFWRRTEIIETKVSTLPLWIRIETFASNIGSPSRWYPVEGWSGIFQTSPRWQFTDLQTASLVPPSALWWSLETCDTYTTSPAGWLSAEIRTGSISSPVPPPANLSPENGFNSADNTPTLSWENLLPADEFELQVDNDQDFSSPCVSEILPGTQTSYTTPELQDNLYWWRVRQFRTGVPSSWSVGYFRVDTTPPGAPLLIFPAPGSSIKDNTPPFRWSSVPENSLPLTYWLQLDNEPAFNEPFLLSVGWLSENQYQLAGELTDGVYYWRVRVRDNAGWIGPWSAGSFRVDTVKPPVPTPISPVSGQWTTPTPTLTWEAVAENSTPVRYKVWICESSSFNESLYTVYTSPWIQENSWTSPVLEEGLGLEGKIFYWRVCAMDDAGNVGENSAIQYFRTDNIPPSKPTLLSPENSSFVPMDVLLIFSAADGSGELSYWVQIYSGGVLVYENTFVPENQLLLHLETGIYLWRVRARDAAGNLGSWSEENCFTVCTWVRVEEWTVSIQVTYGWRVVENWTESIRNVPGWIALDSWGFTSLTVPSWRPIESWGAASLTLPEWTEIESFGGRAQTISFHRMLETWETTVSCPAQWSQIESVVGSLNFPSSWFSLDQLACTGEAVTLWVSLDAWLALVRTVPSWREADFWTGDLRSQANWHAVDSASAQITWPTSWHGLDSWGGGTGTIGTWEGLETFSSGIGTPPAWLHVEALSTLVHAPCKWRELDIFHDLVASPVPTPTLASPPDGLNINPNTTPLILQWENLLPADYFDLQIDNDPDFSSPEVSLTVTSNQYQPSGLSDNLYNWRVRQWRTGAFSGWSAVWRFRVDTIAPAEPSPLYPGDGENLNDPTPLLRWTTPPENSFPLTYRVEISVSKYFEEENIVWASWVSENQIETPFLPDNVYHWRVLARDNAGNNGLYSAVRKFRVDTLPPAAPQLSSPENDSWVTSSLTLRWSDVPENSLPVRYNVLIAYDPSFTLIVENVWILENRLDVTLEEGTYWWKVRACDNAGNSSGWSQIWRFRCDNTPPSKVQLVSPENLSFLPEGSITFKWQSATDEGSGVSHYWFQLWRGELLAYENQEVVENSLTVQIEAGSYRWRVRSVDVAGNLGQWSDSWLLDACRWREAESWTGRARTTVGWAMLEASTILVTSPALWRKADSLDAALGCICLWRGLEEWAGSASSPAGWFLLQGWTGGLTNLPCWTRAESWQCGVATMAEWLALENLVGEISAGARWIALESWIIWLPAPVVWKQLESFSSTTPTPATWFLLGEWTCGIRMPVSWFLVESRLAQVRFPASWNLTEVWSDGLAPTICVWYRLEERSGGAGTIPAWAIAESWSASCPSRVCWLQTDSLSSTLLFPAWWRLLELRSVQVQAPLYPPANLSPENGLNTSDNTPTLSWENLQPVDYFELQVDNDESFSSPEISVTLPGTQTSYTTFPLPDNLYWWRVRCYRTGTPSGWSVRTFRIDTLKPAPPELLSPSDGQDVNDPTPLLRWTVPPENSLPLIYCLRISNSPYFEPENIVIETWVSDNAHEVSGLQENVTYYWKVCAADNAGNVGNFQENAWRFKIDTVMPSAPSLLHPENNGWASAKPNLDWLPVPENSPPVLYRVEVSDFPDFINLTRVAEIYSDNWIVSPPLPVSTYYWRVKARDNAGNWGPWSTVWRFKVDIDPPSKPTLLAPENEAHVQAGQPFTLCYTASDVGSGVAQYTVQISDEPNFYLPQVDVTVSENTHVAPGLAWGTYYWRVKAIDSVGNVGPWSDPFILYSSDWLPLDSFTVTVRGRAGWVSIETWLLTLSSPSTWHFVDSWAYELENLVAGWFWVDELSASGIGVHYWTVVEGWACSVKGAAGWRGIELWSSSLRSYPEAFWRELEGWSATSRAWVAWDAVESWLWQLYSEASWAEVDVLTATCTGVHYWVTLESWTGSVVNRQWRTLESWKPKVRAPASFKPLESLSWSVGVPPSEWSLCESLRAGGRGTLGSWKTLEALTARSLPARWRILESAAGRIQTTACWRKIDNRSLTLEGPSIGYLQLDSCSGRISAPHIWTFLESMGGSVSSPIRWKTIIQSAYLPKFGWFGLESWGGSIFAPRFLEERVTRTVEALTSQVVELTNLSPSLNRFWYRSLPPSARVSVAESRYLPPWLPKLPAELYVYLDLILENGVPLRMRIEVEKSWLQQMNRDTLKVWGYRGDWAELSYSLAGEDGRSLYLEFEPSGYSCFAVTAKRAPTFPTWVIFWVWLGIIGTISCVMMYPAASEFWARRTQRKLMRIIEAPPEEIDRRLRSYGRKLHRRERTDLARLAEELITPTPPPPRVIPVLEKLTKPELVAVETLERFIRERRREIPLKKREVEELKKLRERMERRKGRS
ncbi:MAG: hypothetical protein QXG14_01475 [Candidatus Hadarchaeales archaeon]